MTFTQRFMKYLMGVGIGLVFVAMAFGPRAFSCNYFPNARVLDEAFSKRLAISPEAQAFLKAENLDSTFLKKNYSKEVKLILITRKKIKFLVENIWQTIKAKTIQRIMILY